MLEYPGTGIMKIWKCIWLMILGFACAGQAVATAETLYVTDSCEITLRSGPSFQNRILQILRSGKPVEILETKEDWSHVRLPQREDKLEGWVKSQYLSDRLPWENQAKNHMKKNKQLMERVKQLETRLQETSSKGQDAASNLKETSQALAAIQGKYETLKKGSANYLTFKKEYDEIKSSLGVSQTEVHRLRKKNEILEASQRNKWFGMGALVLLCGLLIGLAMGKHQKKQKSSILYG